MHFDYSCIRRPLDQFVDRPYVVRLLADPRCTGNYFSRLTMNWIVAKTSAASSRNSGQYRLGAYHIGGTIFSRGAEATRRSPPPRPAALSAIHPRRTES